jgi:hypothetical protein
MIPGDEMRRSMKTDNSSWNISEMFQTNKYKFQQERGFFLNSTNPSGRTRPWGLLSL